MSAPPQALARLESTEQETGRHDRTIPSLDGLRAFAVLAVVLGHCQVPFLKAVPFLENGNQGVAVFFLLSGFLITHLLLRELKRSDRIHFGQFYFRRSLRIFPPFYVYLLAVAILRVTRHLPVTRGGLIAAATYTWNYVPLHAAWPMNWALAHCWSLSLEEQFYLLWPISMALLSRRANLRLAAGLILLSPLSRVATYFLWPSTRTHLDMMLHTHVDTVMFGCMLALAIDLGVGERVRRLALSPLAPALAIFFLLAIDAPLAARWRGVYRMTLGISLENVAMAVIVLYAVARHHSPLGSLLNLRPVKHIGRISYSLYLWQQLFTGPMTWRFPLNMGVILLVAELSYRLVERPSFALRDWLGARLFPAVAPRLSVGLPAEQHRQANETAPLRAPR